MLGRPGLGIHPCSVVVVFWAGFICVSWALATFQCWSGQNMAAVKQPMNVL